jgi:localization factor PodJL
MRAAVQGWTPELQPDDAVTVKAPAGGWDAAAAPTASKTKIKRAGGGRVATTF